LERRTAGQQHQDGSGWYLLDHEVQQFEGRWVSPVQVFQDEQHRLLFCVFLQDGDDGFERFLSLPLR
jgi:hypothetical protein